VPAGDVPRVAAFLGELASVPFSEGELKELRAARADPILLGDQMRSAWEDFLAAECAAAPVLIVLDDLHWGDLATVKLLEASLRNLRDQRLMVLALARPEVDELFPKLWAGRVTQVPLEELTKRASSELARAVLGDASEQAVSEVVERAGGNAFYLEELLRAVARGSRDLPETVLDVAAARLEAQDPDARRVLRAASVFGQAFWASGVRELLGGDDCAVDVALRLADLATEELVARRAQSRFPGEHEYVFRSALVQEAAHATLTDTDAALGHRLAGVWLERAGERDAAVLAEHFERGGELDRAVVLYRRAAQQALRGDDFGAVAWSVQRGLACGALGVELGRLMHVAAEAHLWRGENVEALRCASISKEALVPQSADWYGAVAEVVTAAGRVGDQEHLFAVVDELLAQDPPEAERSVHVVAAARAAARLLLTGHRDAAEEIIEQIERLGRPLAAADPGLLGAMTGLQAVRSLWLGDPGGYLAGMLAASEAYERGGDRRNACMARVNMSSVLLEVGDYAGARSALGEGLAVAERLGIQPIIALARCNLGLSIARLGDPEQGAQVEIEAVQAFAAQGDRRMEGACRIYLAAIYQLTGDVTAALREAREARDILAASPPTRACALARLGDALLQSGDAAEALEASREAVELLDTLQGTDEGDSLARVVYAEALFRSGDEAAAHAAIATARERVLLRASRITVAAWRASFLAAIPENARTLELAARWLGTAPPPDAARG
jgi:tetratricopeptide (TPR) repeat protein